MTAQESGTLNGSIIGVLIGGVLLGALFIYYAFVVGEPVPIWQALLVGAVNIVAAARLFVATRRARQEREAAQRLPGDKQASR